MKLRMPPRIKVLEAAGSIADGRIKREGGLYRVVSSEGEVRVYTVKIDGTRVDSDDNGTVYRGYVGYPIIAALMVEGRLPYDPRIGGALRGIKWKRLNEEYKNYSVVEGLVKEKAAAAGVDPAELDRYIERVLGELRRLGLEKP